MADRRLSARVRAGTRAEHDAAQGSGFLDALAAGRLPLDAYADLAVQHWFVYETLEDAGEDPAVRADDDLKPPATQPTTRPMGAVGPIDKQSINDVEMATPRPGWCKCGN